MLRLQQKFIIFFSNVIKDQFIKWSVSLLSEQSKERGILQKHLHAKKSLYMGFTFLKRDIFYSRKSYFTAENNSWFLCSCVETCLVLNIFNGNEYVQLRKYLALRERKREHLDLSVYITPTFLGTAESTVTLERSWLFLH